MNRVVHYGLLSACIMFAAGMTARAQFKETPPAPYPPDVAREKIRTLIGNADPGSGQQTTATLTGLLVWYRDIVDDELIAAWKGDARANLPGLMASLADVRVATAIVDFSWRQQRDATFNFTYAPALGDLMARYPASADPMLRDLLGPAAGGKIPELSQQEADAVCRILLDLPDTGNWRKLALQILPHYRATVQNLLAQDMRGSNQEKATRAQYWLNDLKLNAPAVASDQPRARLPNSRQPAPQTIAQAGPDTFSGRPHIVEQPSTAASLQQAMPAPQSTPAPQRSGAAAYVPEPFTPAPFSLPYSGPQSGTLKCSGSAVPPNGEYVFHDMPPGNLQIDVDGKPWAARLAPGPGQTQDLILTNKASSAQKKCTVRWNIAP